MQPSPTMTMPEAHEVNSQLERILGSKEFSSSQKLKDFLNYVVDETLAGRGAQIKAYNIGLEVFRLGKKFDPGYNTIVRVTAGRLRNKLERYYLKSSREDRVYIEIPKGSYVPSFRYFSPDLPLPVANPPDAGQLDEQPTAPPVAGIKPPKALQRKPTIMVLPFSDLTDNRSLRSFAQGLAEEMAIALNRYDEFVVFTPHPREMNQLDQWELAEKTGARFIITGSAQLSDNNLRLRVVLADALSRFHVWSDKFESRLEAASQFSVQDEITEQVVARIADSFNFIHRLQLKNEIEESAAGLEVYEAMLFYHYWIISLTAQHFLKTKKTLHIAVDLEPMSASLKGMLSDVYASHFQWGLDIEGNALEMSMQLAEDALELDSGSQYANWAMAYNCFLRREKTNFLAYVHKSLAINPSNTNIMATASVKMIMSGQHEEGMQMLHAALRLNPHIPSWYRLALFIVHYMQGNYEVALSEAKHVIIDNFIWGHLARSAALGMLGRKEQGRQELDELLRIRPTFADTARSTLLRLFFEETSVDKLLIGLAHSGLETSRV